MFRGVDEGSKKTSLPLSKRGRLALSECPTFSDFGRSDNENIGENRNTDEIESTEVTDLGTSFSAAKQNVQLHPFSSLDFLHAHFADLTFQLFQGLLRTTDMIQETSTFVLCFKVNRSNNEQE